MNMFSLGTPTVPHGADVAVLRWQRPFSQQWNIRSALSRLILELCTRLISEPEISSEWDRPPIVCAHV
jgi:hypothetical protein